MQRVNANRETPWRPIVVYSEKGGVEAKGMEELFKAEHIKANGKSDVPKDVVILDDADIPGLIPEIEKKAPFNPITDQIIHRSR